MPKTTLPVRRPFAGLDTDPWGPIDNIRALLEDVYRYDADGRTIVRELFQNADDAGASTLVLAIAEDGLQGTSNPLLAGPALVVVNDGPFPEKDHDGLHRAIGGAKRDDAAKVGRFGLGLKSLFHLCEAFVYLGRDGDSGRDCVGALNPWAGTDPEKPGVDPRYPEWDEVQDGDYRLLAGLGERLLAAFARDGLLLWVPLRRRTEHLDRGHEPGTPYGISTREVQAGDLRRWFADATPLALLLAQAGAVRRVMACLIPPTLEEDWARPLCDISRTPTTNGQGDVWLGRPVLDAGGREPLRSFHGKAATDSRTWAINGSVVRDDEVLECVRERGDWPRDRVSLHGRVEDRNRKAAGHASVALVRPTGADSAPSVVRIRWCVFFPLDDSSAMQSTSPLVEAHPTGVVGGVAWDVLLHGYFWPAQDRRSIPGVVETGERRQDLDVDDVRVALNRAIAENLLLPLIPQALDDSLAGLSGAWANAVVGAVLDSSLGGERLEHVCRDRFLVPVLQSATKWKATPRERRLIALAGWNGAPDNVKRHLSRRVSDLTPDTVLIDGDAQRLGGAPQPWSTEEVALLLNMVPEEQLREGQVQEWLERALRTASGSATGCLQEPVADVFAQWLGRRLGAAPLEPRALDAWRRLFDLVPASWRVRVPRGARAAVAELASEGLLGAGLVVMPLGVDAASQARERGGRPDRERLERALKTLGTLLSKTTEPQSRTMARVVLAECLLAELVDAGARERISNLPLMRAHRLPEGRDEAWSLADLQGGASRARVFRREVSTTTDADPDADVDMPPQDPLKRVRALAHALGESCWLVRTGLEHDIHLAHPTDTELAAALVRGDVPLAEAVHRRSLLAIIGSREVAETPVGRQAIRALLTGERKCSDNLPLFYVPTAGTGNTDTEAAAKLLLRLQGRPWALFPSSMTDLRHVVLQTVDAHHPIDNEALHLLLAKVLEAAHAPWAGLDVSETVLLLKVLHPGISAPDKATRWRKMPLHRRVDGMRGPITERTFKPVAGVDLPAAIQAAVVLLRPDEELRPYYADIPDLDRVHALALLLASSAPQDYAAYILRLLFVEGQEGVVLPPPPVRDRLRTIAWIPLEPRPGRPQAVSPDLLLLVPRPVEVELAPMISAGSLRPRFFPEEVAQDLRNAVVAVARSLRANPGEPRQVEGLAEAVRASRSEQRTFSLFNLSSSPLTPEVLWAGLDSPLAHSDPGWRLARASRDACGPPNDNVKAAIEKLAAALVGPVPTERQVSMLGALSALAPGRDSPEGKVHKGMLTAMAPVAPEVLARLDLPVQDGTWKPATTVARSASGLARCHLLRLDLRETLGLDDHSRPSGPIERRANTNPDTSSAGARLRRYFNDWQGRVKPGVVGTFLALLGDYQTRGTVEAMAMEWLIRDPSLRDVSVRDLRERLRGGGLWPVVPPPMVAAAFSEGDKVIAINLVGEDFEASAEGTEVTTIFSQDPVHTHHYGMQVWDIRLRKVDPTTQSPAQLENLVSAALQWWCKHALRVPPGQISEVVKLAEGSQLAVEPVRACILASLPLTLRQLNVNEHRPLMEALLNAESAQRRRAQAPMARMMEAARAERQALESLGKTITESTEHDAFLRARVRERIEAFGYGVASTLLELSQNADDALAQLEEMRGSLPDAARTLTVRVHAMENGTAVDVVHFGRPINETGGAAFPAGINRQWDMDLYFMMLMNLSAKPGEAAGGEPGTTPTTGKFGLGFKSVHLVSDLPEVVSGFLSFEVAAGLLPEASPRPDDPALQPISGCYPTRIRLPLRQSSQTTSVLGELFARFGVARAILPAFSRAIRKVVVEGGPSPGHSEYHGCPLVQGWSVSSDAIALGDEYGWKLLRFALRDRGVPQDSAAVLLGVRDGQVSALPESVPFLWNVTPTGEAWNVGYSVNGPVKLDPGRAHADLDNEETKRVFARLGKSLGTALIELDDRIAAGDRAVLEPLGVEPHGADALRQSLWSQLSRGLAADDRKRTALLRQLHGPNRGLYAWMSERAIAPTGLPAPFASRLPPGVPRELQVASDALEDPDVCAALALIDGLADSLAALPAVSQEIAGVIRSISPGCRMVDLGLGDILAKTVTLWKSRLTPARLVSLQALTTDPVHPMVRREGHGDWGSALLAQAADGSWQSLRMLLIPERDARSEGDEGSPPSLDESLRAAFAPGAALLAQEYFVDDAMIEAFRRLRTRHEVDAALLWQWVCKATPERQAMAIRYLAIGELRGSLLDAAVKADPRPVWLMEFSYVSRLLESSQVRQHEANQVLVTLFPDHFSFHPGPPPPPPPPQPDYQPLPIETARQLVHDLHDQWRDADYRARAVAAWRDRWYPSGWSDDRLLRALREHPCDDDESQTAWMIMFTLATTQGLGRTQPKQHRGFVEALMSRRFENGRSWWSHLFERFDDRSNKDTWFAFLEGWADARVGGRSTYDHWLTTLPELFAAWRWLPDYRDLVVATGRMESGSLVPLLRPRVDPEQDRGGIDAPPLPVVRHHWLLNELLRLGVLPLTPPLMEAAWPPSRALEVVMQLLGLDVARDSQAFSRRVFKFMEELLGPERDPTFFNCFDKPLLSDCFRQSLEHACEVAGLETPAPEDLDDVGAGWMGEVPDEDAFGGGEE